MRYARRLWTRSNTPRLHPRPPSNSPHPPGPGATWRGIVLLRAGEAWAGVGSDVVVWGHPLLFTPPDAVVPTTLTLTLSIRNQCEDVSVVMNTP